MALGDSAVSNAVIRILYSMFFLPGFEEWEGDIFIDILQ